MKYYLEFKSFVQENALENKVFEMSAILSQRKSITNVRPSADIVLLPELDWFLS